MLNEFAFLSFTIHRKVEVSLTKNEGFGLVSEHTLLRNEFRRVR